MNRSTLHNHYHLLSVCNIIDETSTLIYDTGIGFRLACLADWDGTCTLTPPICLSYHWPFMKQNEPAEPRTFLIGSASSDVVVYENY